MLGAGLKAARLAGRNALRAAAALTAMFVVLVGVGPLTGLYRTVTVLTGSMAPDMPAGSMAVVRPVPPAALKVGDVVTYQAPIPGQPVVTHRIVEIDSSGSQPVIRTRGDANAAPDPWAARVTSATAFRRVATIPYLGTVNRALRSGPVHLAFSYLAPLLLLITLLGHIWSPSSIAGAAAGLATTLAPAWPAPPHPGAATTRPHTPWIPGAMALAGLVTRGRREGGRNPGFGGARAARAISSARVSRRPSLALGAVALVAVPALSIVVRRTRP